MWIDDLVLKRYSESVALDIWIPEQTMVVLGAGNLAQMEINEEYCALNHIEVLKRAGGGGTVVLYPGCVIISLGCWVKQHFQNRIYFTMINNAIAECLNASLPQNFRIQQRGVSDLCIGDYKFAGTSMFRSKNYLMYQASLICQRDQELIDGCLRHPSREPDYRNGRPHAAFIRGLQEFEPGLNPLAVKETLDRNLATYLRDAVKDELITPQQEQYSNLKNRLERGD